MIEVIEGVLKGYEPDIKSWDKPTIRQYNGKKIEGRPTKGYGRSSFEYAGKVYKPEPWTISMDILKMATELLVYRKLNRVIKFSFCLCGLYETGKIGIPHHSDTVPTLDDLVVGVSFGAPRILEWIDYGYNIKEETNTSKTNISGTANAVTRRYLLKDGDVYIFDGHSQMTSTHSIPTIENVDKRINLTFRTGL